MLFHPFAPEWQYKFCTLLTYMAWLAWLSCQVIAEDSCGIRGSFPTTDPCNGNTNSVPLTDGRGIAGNGQCRTICKNFSHPAFAVEQTSTNCSLCSFGDVNTFVFPGQEFSNKICIPRSLCISRCGPEPPGCLYTGSCGSLSCFKGSSIGKPAFLKRITYNGLRSVLTVDNSTEDRVTTTDEVARIPPVLNVNLRIEDQCINMIKSFPVSTDDCDNGKGDRPLGRNSQGTGQCRAICASFKGSDYEIVRVKTTCGACNGQAGLSFGTTILGQFAICIPRSICIRQCGPERPGCIYTGSCRSQICFSGIDSKKPAVFLSKTTDGPGTVINVDNEGTTGSIDPPGVIETETCPLAKCLGCLFSKRRGKHFANRLFFLRSSWRRQLSPLSLSKG